LAEQSISGESDGLLPVVNLLAVIQYLYFDGFSRNGMQMINGKAVLFKGVNRHEHDPHKGRTISVASMIHDIQLMKQFNLNGVRNCHYPNYSAWYELCTEFGLYMVDEANIESHGMMDHKDGTLANYPDWELPFMERMSRMIHATVTTQPSSPGPWVMNPDMANILKRCTIILRK